VLARIHLRQNAPKKQFSPSPRIAQWRPPHPLQVLLVILRRPQQALDLSLGPNALHNWEDDVTIAFADAHLLSSGASGFSGSPTSSQASRRAAVSSAHPL
jgi:hypothetical protein